jgi:Arc/MetJ-type ribon-helix-helix transcriptional regulator
MNTQINLRLPDKMLESAKEYAEKHGFGNVQEFIKETVREKLFEELTKKEMHLVKKLAEAVEKGNLYGTEKELFRKLREK